MDVSAHREVDEDEDVEFDEDGEREEDGVEDEASQTQSPVQSPFVQMDAKNLQTEQKTTVNVCNSCLMVRNSWTLSRYICYFSPYKMIIFQSGC